MQPLVPNYVSRSYETLYLKNNVSRMHFTGITNYESLLNNVPPNVSLQRSNNVVPDSQLSPGFTQSMMQLSPNQPRAQFSPQPNAGKYLTQNSNV